MRQSRKSSHEWIKEATQINNKHAWLVPHWLTWHPVVLAYHIQAVSAFQKVQALQWQLLFFSRCSWGQLDSVVITNAKWLQSIFCIIPIPCWYHYSRDGMKLGEFSVMALMTYSLNFSNHDGLISPDWGKSHHYQIHLLKFSPPYQTACNCRRASPAHIFHYATFFLQSCQCLTIASLHIISTSVSPMKVR